MYLYQCSCTTVLIVFSSFKHFTKIWLYIRRTVSFLEGRIFVLFEITASTVAMNTGCIELLPGPEPETDDFIDFC